ncbi:hypothetical protein [Roseateles sp. MS654]|uniref:hypothetical protein n=1 Tax=Roseateles sp. MS654 TaxID=3412685 RepID=UPI003C2E8FD1
MNREAINSLAWGVGIIALALVASAARKLGYIDGETVTRLVIGAMGLMVAGLGNRMPKEFVPHPWARRLRRVAGWSLVLSGIVYAALWAFAPIQLAIWGGTAAVLLGIAVTIGYGVSLRARVKGT